MHSERRRLQWLSALATCDKPSGSPQDFTVPQEYTVTSEDGLRSTVYTVWWVFAFRHASEGETLTRSATETWLRKPCSALVDRSLRGRWGGWEETLTRSPL